MRVQSHHMTACILEVRFNIKRTVYSFYFIVNSLGVAWPRKVVNNEREQTRDVDREN
jgi:hypothetical protein